MSNSVEGLKRVPLPGIPNVDEVEKPSGERSLCPKEEWLNVVSGSELGSIVYAASLLMETMGIPPKVILTIVAVRFADAERKIDYVEWIRTRSGWSEEEKEMAVNVLKRADERTDALSSLMLSKASSAKKDPKWNVN